MLRSGLEQAVVSAAVHNDGGEEADTPATLSVLTVAVPTISGFVVSLVDFVLAPYYFGSSLWLFQSELSKYLSESAETHLTYGLLVFCIGYCGFATFCVVQDGRLEVVVNRLRAARLKCFSTAVQQVKSLRLIGAQADFVERLLKPLRARELNALRTKLFFFRLGRIASDVCGDVLLFLILFSGFYFYGQPTNEEENDATASPLGKLSLALALQALLQKLLHPVFGFADKVRDYLKFRPAVEKFGTFVSKRCVEEKSRAVKVERNDSSPKKTDAAFVSGEFGADVFIFAKESERSVLNSLVRSSETAKTAIAYSPQPAFVLGNASLKDNIVFGMGESAVVLAEALKLAEIRDELIEAGLEHEFFPNANFCLSPAFKAPTFASALHFPTLSPPSSSTSPTCPRASLKSASSRIGFKTLSGSTPRLQLSRIVKLSSINGSGPRKYTCPTSALSEIAPLGTGTKPPIASKSVDFPLPVRPLTRSFLPTCRSNVTSSSALFRFPSP